MVVGDLFPSMIGASLYMLLSFDRHELGLVVFDIVEVSGEVVVGGNGGFELETVFSIVDDVFVVHEITLSSCLAPF